VEGIVIRCEEVRERDIVERYVAGRLPAAAREEFEAHFFACDDCFRTLELATAVREGFRAGARVPELNRRPHWLAAMRIAAVAILVAAGAVGLWQLAPQRPASPIVALGTVDEVPPYLPAVFRGATPADSATRLFDRGMKRYVEGSYGEAVRALKASIELDASKPVRHFYLGVALLADGDAAAAISPLRAAAEQPDLSVDARFYLAKAHLQRGEVDPALQALRAAGEGEGRLAEAARRLMIEVRQATNH